MFSPVIIEPQHEFLQHYCSVTTHHPHHVSFTFLCTSHFSLENVLFSLVLST